MKVTWLIPVILVAGVLIGYGSGLLAVLLEVREKLQEEEARDQRDYVLRKQEAEDKEETFREKPPRADRYGMTWMEQVASPALVAILFMLFVLFSPARHDLRSLLPDLLWVVVFVHIALFDIKHGYILNWVTYPALVVALVLSFITPGVGFIPALVGAVVVYLFFALPSLIAGGRLIGGGDAKLGAIVGAVTGLGLHPVNFTALEAVFLGVLLGGLAAIFMLVTRLKGLRDSVAYGPFICAGAIFVLFRGI